MPCGQTYWVFKGVSKVVEFTAREFLGQSAEDARGTGLIIGGAAAAGAALATFDAAGAAATAADIGSGQRSIENY